jgi:hypothetical protein
VLLTEVLTISIIRDTAIRDLNGTLQSVYSKVVGTLALTLTTCGLASDYIFHTITN